MCMGEPAPTMRSSEEAAEREASASDKIAESGNLSLLPSARHRSQQVLGAVVLFGPQPVVLRRAQYAGDAGGPLTGRSRSPTTPAIDQLAQEHEAMLATGANPALTLTTTPC